MNDETIKKIYENYINIKNEFSTKSFDFGNIENEIDFFENLIKVKRCLMVLNKTEYEGEICFFISNMYKSYQKCYNVFSCSYAFRAYKTSPNNIQYVVTYIENILFLKNYDASLNLIKQFSNRYPAIVELYTGLLKYIHQKPDYLEHIKNFTNLASNKEKTIYQAIPLKSYCFDENLITDNYIKKDCYVLNDIDDSKMVNKKMAIVCSCDLHYFKKYEKYLLYSFVKYKKSDFIMVIDLICNGNDIDENLEAYILNLNNLTNIEICKKNINEKNVKAYSSTLRLMRVNNLLKKYNISCIMIDFDSIFVKKIDELLEIIKDYDICTRELDKVYPWQKYTCGFVYFNNTEPSKLLSDYTCSHLNNAISFVEDMWWIDQNALEVGIRKMKNNIKIKNVISLKDNYILSPTGNDGLKKLQLEKFCGSTDYDITKISFDD